MKLVGYGAVFYSPRDAGTEFTLSASLSERIAPTAFDSTLRGKADVVAAWNHNPDFLLGRRSAGTLKLSKDSRGLMYEVEINEADPQHQSVAAKVRRGDVIGSSFSFAIVKESVESTRDGYVRTIEDVRLFEVGPVWSPAYPSTTASIRSDAAVGSVRWIAENPAAAERWRRVKHIEREIVLDRLAEIERYK